MLEKIINITPGSDFKNSSRPSKYSKTSQFMHAFQTSIGDSVSLSPATSYLSSINWRLKKFVNEKDKITITFEFDSIEFTVNINQNDLLSITSFEYDVKKIFELFSSRYEFLARVNSHYSNQNSSGKLITLPTLNQFIKDVADLASFMDTVTIDNQEVQKIIFKIEDALKSEFNYLDRCLITFFQKYLSLKINHQSLANTGSTPLLKKVQVTKQ